MKRMNRLMYGFCILIIGIGLSGCTVIFQKGRRSDLEKIDKLSSQLDELASARNLLAERLKQEIADKDVRLDMAEKGLVITFVADILFDSGKAKLRSEAIPTLEKVAVVLKDNLNDFNIGIEGHTDTQPIKYSGWESNWELSSARALSVLHYLEEKSITGRRMSADAYGEFHPVASNDSKEGMKMNRRVEIVVLPKVAKVRKQEENASAAIEEEPVTKGPKSYFK
ncbi:MAG TPA: flagellar motor protein MotB [Candidatus Omnitrophica bacterium]|nr:flagellar motor protein MotB [Candidatus Omnitrophota bacterium]